MPVYNSVTFDVIREGAFQPDWNRQHYVSHAHYPGTDLDEVQFGGRGHRTLQLKAIVYSQADVYTLESSVGDTERDLTELRAASERIAAVMLVGMTNIQRLAKGDTSGVWQMDLTFEIASATMLVSYDEES